MAIYSENIDVSVNKITGATIPNPITVTIPFAGTYSIFGGDPSFNYSISGSTLTLSYIGDLPAGKHSLFVGVGNISDSLWVYINLTVVNPHVLKYYIENKDLEDNLYRLEILERGFTGTDKQIRGRIIHDYAERKELLDCIIASNLKIDLEADSELSLQDLYSEDEGMFLVKLYRNSQKIFHGTLKPDGIIEDFVSDKWEISMEAVDGLSVLKNLSFVNLDQTLVIGKKRIFEIVRICLSRIGYDLPINMYLPINYVGNANPDKPILWTTIINADRFYKEKDSSQPMDCETVLKSCLEIFGATILQMNGEWFIFRAVDFGGPTMGFYRYVDGVDTGVLNVISTGVNLGSQINGYDIHHINANQMKSIKPSVQAFLVNYKYGLTSALHPNPNIEFTGSSGLSAAGWTIYDVGTTLRATPTAGLMVANDLTYLDNRKLIESTSVVSLSEGDRVTVIIRGQNGYSIKGDNNISIYYYKIETANYILSGNPASYKWLPKSTNPNARWGATGIGRAYINFEHVADLTMPESGNIKVTMELIRIYAKMPEFAQSFRPFILQSITITPQMGAEQGENHIIQRKTRKSTVVKPDITVYNGSSDTDSYIGTVYRQNLTPAVQWYRPTDGTDRFPLLRILTEDNLRIAPRPMIRFEGDIYGYIGILSHVTINNVSGKFQVSKYSHDIQTNINKATFTEYATDTLSEDDYTYEMTYDYGNVKNVKINT